MRRKKILTLIVTYNGKPWIDRCLQSIRNSTIPVDCLIVDNDSPDKTDLYVEQHYPEVRLIRTGENLGFGRANNIGMQIAVEEGYDYVLLLNQDAGIAPNMVENLLRKSEAEPETGIFSPLHLNGAETDLDFGFADYLGCRTLTEFNERYKDVDPLYADFVNAAIWLVPTSVLKKVGGFDPFFRHYGEDVDWVNRLHYHGYKIRVVRKAMGYHDRAARTVTPEMRLFAQDTYFRTELKNIKYSFFRSYLMGVVAIGKELLLSLQQRKLSATRAYARMIFQRHREIPAILGCRKRCKRPNAPYL